MTQECSPSLDRLGGNCMNSVGSETRNLTRNHSHGAIFIRIGGNMVDDGNALMPGFLRWGARQSYQDQCLLRAFYTKSSFTALTRVYSHPISPLIVIRRGHTSRVKRTSGVIAAPCGLRTPSWRAGALPTSPTVPPRPRRPPSRPYSDR